MNSQMRVSSRWDRPSFRRLYPACFLVACIASVFPNAWASPAPTTTSLAITSSGSGVTSVAAGAVVTLTATVVSGSTPVNPGQVNFCDAAAKYCTDIHLLGTAQLTLDGKATFKFRPGPGSHSYQAAFVGTASYAKSTSTSGSLSVVGPFPTATSIASSGQPGNYTLTATVVGPGNPSLFPTGTVSFLDTTKGNAPLGTGTLGTATLKQSFSTSYASGSYSGISGTGQTAVGDFNGDGIPDLITGNPGQGVISVLLGKGDGTFTENDVEVSNAPLGTVVVGDFNSDGIQDLAVAVPFAFVGPQRQDEAAIVILQGNGDGTFTRESPFSYPGGPILLGDFNGDGIPDLVALGYTTFANGTVTVLLGNGDGTFTAQSPLTAGCYEELFAVADFNRDGNPDLAVLCGTGLSVLLGNGDGTFTVKTSSGPQSVGDLAVGDFNGDGVPDLACLERTNSTEFYGLYGSEVVVLLGNGDGTLTTGSSTALDGGLFSLAAGDFNGDGVLDLAVGAFNADSTTSDVATILLGNGDGTFKVSSSLNFATVNNASTGIGITAADFNGDGTPDLALVAQSDFAGILSVDLNDIGETATAVLNGVSVSAPELHQVIASFSGDTNYKASTSGSLPLLASQIVTTLTLSASPNPIAYGYPVLLTAVLTPASFATFSTDREIVTFYSGAINIGTGTLSSGVATFSAKTLAPGINTLSAVYEGDSNFAPATSNSVSAQLLQTAQPVIGPPGGTYTTKQAVIITDTTPEAVIYYTTNGAVPNRSSLVFNSMQPIAVTSSQTIKALAVAPNYATSPEAVAIYNIIPPYAAIPTFTLATGFYNSSQTVSIIDSTPGAIIYYTTNNTTPTTSSTRYTGGVITITSTERLEAIAVAPNYSQSAVAIGTYYISTAQPQISPAGGTYSGPQTATITDSTPGAVIYYTFDGTTPNRASPSVSSGGSILVSSSETIKALAMAPGYTTSAEGVARFTITP